MCMKLGCARVSAKRGLCIQHYDGCKREVNRGRVTWKTLELAGKCLVAIKAGGKIGRKFTREISELSILYRGDKQKIKQHLNAVRERIKKNEPQKKRDFTCTGDFT